LNSCPKVPSQTPPCGSIPQGPSVLAAQCYGLVSAAYRTSLLPQLNKALVSQAPMSHEDAAERYRSSGTKALQRLHHRWEDATRKRRDRDMVEFASWLSSMPSESGKTLDNCCPGDLLVYMEDHWLPRHPGTMLPNGERVASPSGVNGVLSTFLPPLVC
jgi:hypothetical protein